MNAQRLIALITASLLAWEAKGDEIRELDAALGDGDLGITISKGAAAVRTRIAPLANATPGEVIKQAGMAFASANPSTFAALAGGGLLAAAKALGDAKELETVQVLAAARAFAASIQSRGKAKLGDKTILDALFPSLDAATAAPDGAKLDAALLAVERAVRETAALQSRRGRAAWLRERSVGHADPGAVAYLRLLQALKNTSTPKG